MNPSPAITFEANLELLSNEAIGPNTSQVETHVLHPDMHDESPDRGNTNRANHKNNRSTYTVSLNAGGGVRVLKHGDQFVEYGQKAIYLRDHYGVGYAPADRAILTIVSID